MSREILQWLNTHTLIGFTDNRGHAWHWCAHDQHGQCNHYPGPIPLHDVQDRLFQWTADSRRLAVETPAGPDTMTHLNPTGQPSRWAEIVDRQAICRSDDTTGTVMGIFGAGYRPSTPLSITWAWCAATGPNATNSRRSPATSVTSTAPPGQTLTRVLDPAA